MIFLTAFVFAIFVLGTGILIARILRRVGYPRSANIFSKIFPILFLLGLLAIVFEDQLFTKRQARTLVEEQQLFLRDKFEIISNSSTSAIGDYYHTFSLRISDTDKFNGIQQIQHSANFKEMGKPVPDLLSGDVDQYNSGLSIQNYETEDRFVREYLETNGAGNAPMFRRIIIYKRNNQLKFEEIDN